MPTNSLAKPLHERLLQSFPADQAYTPADWNTDAMPGPVRHYLDHYVRHHGKQEANRLRRARTDWVNYDHPEVEQAARAFLKAAENHTQVPQDQWTETLRTASHRTADYLVRPVPTLTSFVFEDTSSAVPVSQIQWRMRFFGPYAYLRDAVQAFANKRNREALERDAFEQVLRRVDERMTADFDADRWVRLLDPLFEMAQRATGQKQVPLPLLRAFFEEKNAVRIADRLTAHELEGNADAADPDTLRRLIDAVLSKDSFERRDLPESPFDPDFQESTEPARVQSAEPSSPKEDTSEAAPMWKQFEQDIPRRSTETNTGNDDGSQPLWTQFQKHTSPSPSDTNSRPSSPAPGSPSTPSSSPSDGTSLSTGSSDDLSALEREVFGPANLPKRDLYVQKLFQGDEDAYRRVLERLRTTERWSEASQIIARDAFRAHQVNIYSDAAVHFTNAVEASFKKE